MRTKLIVNPFSNKGHTQTLLPQIVNTLQQLEVNFDLVQTEAVGHGIELTRQAIAAGYERLVAVGGDGTCSEVVNGVLTAPPGAVVGVIPCGSGNDLACSLQIPTDIVRACEILKNGSVRVIDVGRVTVDGQARFFDNSVGLGFDAEVSLDTRRIKVLRGFAMYMWSVFRVLFFGRWPYSAQFSFNGQTHQQPITLLTVGNGMRAGGGFYLTPQAQLDDGQLDICYASQMSKLTLLTVLPKTFNGTHIYHPTIRTARSGKVEVVVNTGIPGHRDGEILCTAGRHFEFEIVPQALRVWA